MTHNTSTGELSDGSGWASCLCLPTERSLRYFSTPETARSWAAQHAGTERRITQTSALGVGDAVLATFPGEPPQALRVLRLGQMDDGPAVQLGLRADGPFRVVHDSTLAEGRVLLERG